MHLKRILPFFLSSEETIRVCFMQGTVECSSSQFEPRLREHERERERESEREHEREREREREYMSVSA
jgi:hypothetical protein